MKQQHWREKMSRIQTEFCTVGTECILDPNLTFVQRLVYVTICAYADPITHQARLTRQQIAQHCGIGVEAVRRAMRVLEKEGFVKFQHAKPSIFTICSPKKR